MILKLNTKSVRFQLDFDSLLNPHKIITKNKIESIYEIHDIFSYITGVIYVEYTDNFDLMLEKIKEMDYQVNVFCIREK